MVKIIFYNLIRSRYKVEGMTVKSGSIDFIITQILETYPEMDKRDFESCIVFRDGKTIHKFRFDTIINDGEEIIITHFVGGG